MTDTDKQFLSRFDGNARMWSILVAYSAGEISEGVACRTFSCDRVELREAIQESFRVARLLDERYRADGTTISFDLIREAAQRTYSGRVCND